ncbi:MAG: HepT-like ribonuclease domain-containing protein [Candidatus Bathyarchaeia archaeon]|jgi:uncharacterized protein with HEPN domain
MSEDHLERSPLLYLSEIIFYIEKIEAITKGLTCEQFLKDEIRVYAVDDLVRNIGEAVRVLSKHKQIRNLFYTYRIPYDRLRNMRTDLTHEYFSADKELLWVTAKEILPNLKLQFRKVLEELK